VEKPGCSGEVRVLSLRSRVSFATENTENTEGEESSRHGTARLARRLPSAIGTSLRNSLHSSVFSVFSVAGSIGLSGGKASRIALPLLPGYEEIFDWRAYR